jgi:hypothetical protein
MTALPPLPLLLFYAMHRRKANGRIRSKMKTFAEMQGGISSFFLRTIVDKK